MFRRYHEDRWSPDGARELARRARAGDAAARRRLVLLGANLVHHRLIVRRYRQLSRWLPMEDAIQEGWVAMIRAVDGYDPDHPGRFSTFAFGCLHNHLNKLTEALRGKRGRTTPRPSVVLLGEDDDGRPWLEHVAEDAPSPWHAVDVAEDAGTYLRQAVGRERVVIGLHYGLDGAAEHGTAQVGASLGITRERALQIEQRAFRRMREGT